MTAALPSRQRRYHALFLCTGNSARSILAESILRAVAGERFEAHSAGSRPVGRVNPFVIEYLTRHGLPVDALRSKGWDEFARPGAPALDFVITVCDNAAGEACPVWPGRPITAHWGLPDPAVAGDDAATRRAVADVAQRLTTRLRLLASLDIDKLDRLSAQGRVREIGRDAVNAG